MLADGRTPFYEPDLEPLLRKSLESGRLRFTTSYAEAATADVHFLCVGTPQRKGEYAADLRYVDGVVDGLAPHLDRPTLVVGKSTVPVGTAARLQRGWPTLAPAGEAVELAWNPEFLREGFAVEDTLKPDRLVFGTASRARRGAAARGLRQRDRGRRAVPRHRLRHRRAGQGLGQRLPGHQDLVHQRDGRALRGHRGRRHPAGRRARLRRRGSAASSSTPGSASAAAACPRTSGRSWPAPGSSVSTRR